MTIWTFMRDEAGSANVDWVVLTGALTGLALGVLGVIGDGAEDISVDIRHQLETDMISATFLKAPGPGILVNGPLAYGADEIATLISVFSSYGAVPLQGTYESYQTELAAEMALIEPVPRDVVDELGAIEEAARQSGIILEPGHGPTYAEAYTAATAAAPAPGG